MVPEKFWVAPHRGPEGGVQGHVRVSGVGQAGFDVTAVAAAGGGGQPAAAFSLGKPGEMKFQVLELEGRRGGENLGALRDGGLQD